MNEVKATDYPQMYIDLGIDIKDLGCIMLDTEPIIINDIVPTGDLYYADPEEQPFVQGNVSENVPHVTLLYGLLSDGKAMFKHVDTVLNGWSVEELTIDHVDFFYGTESDYVTVIALLNVSDELLNAQQRLSLLPHINTFGSYKPHITLAYLKSESQWEQIVSTLNERLAGKTIKPIAINYGE